MNYIKRRKNGGDLILEPLKNGLNDLRDGEEFVYLSKHDNVIVSYSKEANKDRVARVIWDYNVTDRFCVINGFDEDFFRSGWYNSIVRMKWRR